MSLSSFLIRIILLVIPGIVASLLYRKLRGRTSRKDWEDYLEILVFSFICHGVYGLIAYALSMLRKTDDGFAAFRAFTNENIPIDTPVGHAIIWASLIAFPIAFVASYIDYHKVVNKLGKKLRVTKRFGDEDVWDFLNRSPDIKWVYVRDHKYDLNYFGWIQAWSDPYKEREVLLREVEVFRNSTGEFLYKTDVIYLSRKHDELTVETDLTTNRVVEKQLESNKEVADEDKEHRG